MKRMMTETDRLAAKMGYRIRRKRDGTFQLLYKNEAGLQEWLPMTMAELENHLQKEWKLGITYTTACGMLIGTVPPGEDRYAKRRGHKLPGRQV
jgi:hypothetical protein